ncbi:MAG TPA: preprotein translocase subunit YajC [Acidimicrobiia bacterium]|nr:preprotein translocase subunit YajC [Acidimicrobiia bacterium]
MLKHRARGAFRSLGLLVLIVALSALTVACLPVDDTTSTTGDGTTEETTQGSGSMILTIVMYAVVIGGLFYFLLIRPQRTRQKKAQELQSSLGVGDEVQTIGGIYGTIEYFDEETDTAIIQVEGGGKLRVARRALAGKVTPKGR